MSLKIDYREVMSRIKSDVDYVAEEAYNKGYEQAKLIWSSKTNEESYQRGLEDGKQVAVGAAELREKLEYQKGFEYGKATHEKGCEGCKYECENKTQVPCIICPNNLKMPCTICTNKLKSQWTAKDDKIVVGDEVIERDGNKTLVSNIHGELFDGLCSDGSTICDLFLEDVVKTGRHFDITSILEAMKA